MARAFNMIYHTHVCTNTSCLQLKDGIFAVDITVAVLSGEVKMKHSGVYFLSATVHFSATPNDACDGEGTVTVAICVNSDCNSNA